MGSPSNHSSDSWSIDQVSETSARVEMNGESFHDVPLSILPAGVKEGDVLGVERVSGAGKITLTITVDREAAARANARSAAATRAITKASRARDPGGDVKL